MSESVTVKFDGQVFGTWNNVELSESVDDMCATVSLGVALPDVGDMQFKDLGLTPNTVLTLWAGDELVSTVRCDRRERSVSASSHSIKVAARSLGRELVDCQYSVSYSGLKLAEIAKRLCSTFKVPLQVQGATAVVPEFAMQSEQPANALINAARAANRLLYPTPDGGVVLTEPTASAAVATLVYGEHFASYRVVNDDKLRFSEYIVRSFDYGESKARKGAAKDTGIEYFRPMHIVGDRMGQSDGASGRRAELERNRRQARAQRIELEVPGWHHGAEGAAKVWRINTQVRVVIPQEDVDAVLLIGDRTFRYDAKGRTTQLVCMDRAAFVGEPKARKKRAAGVAR